MERRSETQGLAAVGHLLAEPTRWAVLLALADGQALPAGELAQLAGVQPSTLSDHLKQLLKAEFLCVHQIGRHRYYALRNSEVANLLEVVSGFAEPPSQKKVVRQGLPEGPAFLQARRCYDHLAGELGVQLTAWLVSQGWLLNSGQEFTLTDSGEIGFQQLGIDVATTRQKRRHFAQRCIDRTVRRPHLGGALGAALFNHFEASDWIKSSAEQRSLRVTVEGRKQLEKQFGIILL